MRASFICCVLLGVKPYFCTPTASFSLYNLPFHKMPISWRHWSRSRNTSTTRPVSSRFLFLKNYARQGKLEENVAASPLDLDSHSCFYVTHFENKETARSLDHRLSQSLDHRAVPRIFYLWGQTLHTFSFLSFFSLVSFVFLCFSLYGHGS